MTEERRIPLWAQCLAVLIVAAVVILVYQIRKAPEGSFDVAEELLQAADVVLEKDATPVTFDRVYPLGDGYVVDEGSGLVPVTLTEEFSLVQAVGQQSEPCIGGISWRTEEMAVLFALPGSENAQLTAERDGYSKFYYHNLEDGKGRTAGTFHLFGIHDVPQLEGLGFSRQYVFEEATGQIVQQRMALVGRGIEFEAFKAAALTFAQKVETLYGPASYRSHSQAEVWAMEIEDSPSVNLHFEGFDDPDLVAYLSIGWSLRKDTPEDPLLFLDLTILSRKWLEAQE